MSKSPTRILFYTLGLVIAFSAPLAHTHRTLLADTAPRPSVDRDRVPATHVTSAYVRTPLRFEPGEPEKRGETDFVARGLGYAVYLSGGDATVVLKPATAPRPEIVGMRLVGRQSGLKVTGVNELPGRSNHLIGRDSRHWRTGVRSYAKVSYEDVYPGVDLVYYGNQQQLEYDFIVAPGASPSRIAFQIDGTTSTTIDSSGNLVLTTNAGTLTHRAPVIYQESNGTRRSIEGRYAVRPDGHVGFHVGEYDERLPLVIDPILNYSTYLGGANQERAHAVAVDAGGHIVVVGETYSSDFPTMNAAQPLRAGFGDAFVAKLTPAGDALVYATYIGGLDQDSASAVRVDAAGAAYVAGSTFSWDFPTLTLLQPDHQGQSDAFIVKLDPSGSLVYSTMLGGVLEDYAQSLAIEDDGRVHVGGSTYSANFPITQNALQSSLGGYPVFRTTNGGDTWTGQRNGIRTFAVASFAFDPASPDTLYAGTQFEGVFKTIDGGSTWAATGELPPLPVYSLAVESGPAATVYAGTHFGVFRSVDGGANWTALGLTGWVSAIAVVPGAPATVYAGLSPNSFPYGVFKSTDGGETWTDTGLAEGVVSMSVSGSTVYAGTINGVFASSAGSTWVPANSGLTMEAVTLVADPTNPAVAYAGNFDGLFRTTNGGASWEANPLLLGVPIAMIAVAPSDPATLYVSSMFGGSAVTNDGGESWRSTHSEGAIATAMAVHPQLSTTAYIGVQMYRDAFIATISPDGSSLEYSTYFGGSSHDEASDIALDVHGALHFVGTTFSTDLPLQNPRQPAFSGLQDAFAATIVGGALGYSTYLGGTGFESAPKVAVDSAGQAHITGVTWSSNYPTANAHQSQPGGLPDVFVSVLTPTGDDFVYSTYLGGNSPETDSGQWLGPDVAVTPAGEAYVTGTTMSRNFPTTSDAFQRVHAGGQNDAFVAKFSATGTLQYSTFLGGAGDDHARSIALDPQGAPVVTGYTTSTNFPTAAPLQLANAGSEDGFIARIGEGGSPSDIVPPVTTVSLAGATGLAGWYRSSVVVTLSASDDDSGVAVTHYRVNGGPLQIYTGPFTVAAQGATLVTAHSTDLAGNGETPAAPTSFRIDSVSPAVGIASPRAIEYLLTQSATVSLSVSDTTSGVAGPASVTLDGLPFAGSIVDMSTLALGPHTLVASAMDVAGNPGQSSVTFHVVTELDTVIEVPAEVPTIQAAIDAAENGFTVLVAPGTYAERINFRGKAITVKSAQGPAVTIIDGGGLGRVVTFNSSETRAAVLSGFTIRNGFDQHSGAGIQIGSSSPTIRGNVVTANRSCTGVGIHSSFGSPRIEGNRVTRNSTETCTGGWGIGIYVGGDSAAEVVDNEITENTSMGATSGGGLALFAAGNAVVSGNLIARNTTEGPWGCGWGGGVVTANFVQAKVFNNVITGNRACFAAGVQWGGTTGVNQLVNNTIVGNEASIRHSGVYVSGFDARQQVFNNIITVASGPALFCENGASVSSPVLNSNNVYSAQDAAYGGTCADQTGINGNVSADPRFVNAAAGDYRLILASPSVDTGNPAAPILPPTDFAGGSRVVDGDGDGTPRVDMGALEYRNRLPLANAGPDQTHAAGPQCSVEVTLNGTGSDPDGDALSFTWTGSFGTVSGASQVLTLPAGTHVITLTVTDPHGGTASDTVVVTVVDDAPPVIASINATPSVLTKANHEMVPVVVTVSVADACGTNVTCRITDVTSNEPVQGGGGAPDWQLTGDLTLLLHAERSGRGDGRVYTITVVCTDLSGNTATSTVLVTVPR